MDFKDCTLDIEERITVNASIDRAFEGLIQRFAEGNTARNDSPMPMVLEQRPGGRWYRDLGKDAGHLWGHVQSIKPPELLEIYGQLFMSYPAMNHLIIRLSQTSNGTEIILRHQALGLLDEDHREGVTEGWKSHLEAIKKSCE